MYKFFTKHKFIRSILDIVVILTIPIIIFMVLNSINLSMMTPGIVPIFLNAYALPMFAYVNTIHEPPEKRLGIINWFDIIRWISGVGLFLHTTFGYIARYSHKVVIEPIWIYDRKTIIVTFAVYACLIIIPSLIVYFLKKKQN